MSARSQSRGMVRGFVGDDGKTHAINAEWSHGRLHTGRCMKASRGVTSEVTFIANPRAPLCLACVAVIEAELRKETP